MSRKRKRGPSKQGDVIPLHSPRHPKNAAESKRIVELLARDAADRERDDRVRKAQTEKGEQPSVFERPANRAWHLAANRDDADAKRRYVPGPGPDHPLTRAREEGRLDAIQYANANTYRLLCKSAFETGWGRDTTQAMMVDGGQANYEAMMDARRGDQQSEQQLSLINRELGKESASILLFVCLLDHKIGDAVRWATPKVHANGVWGRFEEAVDALGRALNPQRMKKSA